MKEPLKALECCWLAIFWLLHSVPSTIKSLKRQDAPDIALMTQARYLPRTLLLFLRYAAYKVLDDYFTGELQHRNSLSAQLNMKCHEFDQKKDMASFCGQGLAAWRYTKPVLVAEINSLTNQLQITIPGLPG